MRDAWEHMEVRPLEIVDAGDQIVSLGQAHLRARGSGVELESRFAAVFWIEKGLIAREIHFADWDEALRAAGITTNPEAAGINSGIKLSDAEEPSATPPSTSGT